MGSDRVESDGASSRPRSTAIPGEGKPHEARPALRARRGSSSQRVLATGQRGHRHCRNYLLFVYQIKSQDYARDACHFDSIGRRRARAGAGGGAGCRP